MVIQTLVLGSIRACLFLKYCEIHRRHAFCNNFI